MEKKDFKIVCVIDSYTSNKNIFYATSRRANLNIFTSAIGRLSETSPLLFINQTGFSNECNDNTWDILLIFDRNNQDANIAKNGTFISFLPDKTLIMWHGNAERFLPKKTLDSWVSNQKIRKYKQGMHDTRPENGYELLSWLIDAMDDTSKPPKFKSSEYDAAKEKLFKWFGLNEKLNKALEFLHSSLGEKPADTKFLTEGDETFDLTNDIYKDKSLQEWIDMLKGKTRDKYDATLADVRDALLWHSGVTRENKVFV